MIKGTTPSLVFNLPFLASLIKSAEIIVRYVDGVKEVLIEKTLADCELGETSIETVLSQEETLQLPAPSTVDIQLRVLTTDDTALATEIYKVKVKRLLKEGVIE